jgi:hypothetical protein
LTRCQRRSAIAKSWKAMSRPFLREPAPLVTRWRRRHRGEGRLDHVARPQVQPVLGGEVEEGEQLGLLPARDGPSIRRPITEADLEEFERPLTGVNHTFRSATIIPAASSC